MSVRSLLIAVAVLAAIFAFGTTGHAQEAGGGPGCPAGVPTDFGYGDALPGPLAIPDNALGGVSDCFTVSGTGTISDLDVAVNITHTWVGDLTVRLTHVDTGRSVILLDRPGGQGEEIGCNGDNVRATFTDESGDPAEDQCNASPPAVYGFLSPTQVLSAFDGDSIGGTWSINVSDNEGGDTGMLDSWTILPSYEPLGGNGDVNCSGDADAIDATLILQIAAGFNFPLPCAKSGDVNANFQLDAIDATLVLQYAAGLLPFLPPGPPIL